MADANTADGVIDAAVCFEQCGVVLAPEHVRILVDTEEVEEEKAFAELVQAGIKQAPMLARDYAALGDVLVLGEDTLAVCSRVLRHTGCVEGADLLGKA